MNNECEYFKECKENFKSFCKEVSELTRSKCYCLIRKNKRENELTNHTFSFDLECNDIGVKEVMKELTHFLKTRQNWSYKHIKVIKQK